MATRWAARLRLAVIGQVQVVLVLLRVTEHLVLVIRFLRRGSSPVMMIISIIVIIVPPPTAAAHIVDPAVNGVAVL